VGINWFCGFTYLSPLFPLSPHCTGVTIAREYLTGDLPWQSLCVVQDCRTYPLLGFAKKTRNPHIQRRDDAVSQMRTLLKVNGNNITWFHLFSLCNIEPCENSLGYKTLIAYMNTMKTSVSPSHTSMLEYSQDARIIRPCPQRRYRFHPQTFYKPVPVPDPAPALWLW